ncbi:DUF2797 domain-containing protein [Chryseobacterium sp. A301]
MHFEGQLIKMITQNASPIQYYLNLSHDLIHMNSLIGKTVEISHLGYQCVNCQREEKIFRMGFCKKCFFESPYTSESIIRPELSKAHLGEGERDLEVEKSIQLVPHIVYLAYTGEVKVGVTRESQVPTRWIDQGATFALPIARTENRYEAGMIEVALKSKLSDKTNYRRMLKDEYEEDLDLTQFRSEVQDLFPAEYAKFFNSEQDLWRLDYPYEAPEKVTTISLEKKPSFTSVLKGIKGQYLAFEGGSVLNVRAHEGFVIALETKKE